MTPATSTASDNIDFQTWVQVNNLFNAYYASHAEGDEFYPAALRNVFASLRIDL